MENVTVQNFMSRGKTYGGPPYPNCPPPGDQGTETFPIHLTTYPDATNDANHLTVRNCFVHTFSSFQGGYFTGIIMKTYDDSVASHLRRPFGQRSVQIGLMENNWIYSTTSEVAPGIALGVANSEMVTMRYNEVRLIKTAVNIDTKQCRDITISNNTFLCDNGINVGASGEGHSQFWDFKILNNTFNLMGEFINTTCGSAGNEKSYGVRLNGGTSNFTIQGNTVAKDPIWWHGPYYYQYWIVNGSGLNNHSTNQVQSDFIQNEEVALY